MNLCKEFYENATQEELLHEAGLGDEMAQAVLSKQAMDYAKAMAHATAMAELMSQEFDVRIKSNNISHKELSMCYFGKLYNPKENHALLLGKTFKAKVNWSALESAKSYMFLTLDNGGEILLDEHNIKKIITNKGMAFKMLAVWKLAAGK